MKQVLIPNLQHKIHYQAKWKCEDCKKYYPYSCELPAQRLECCVIYDFSDGVRGAPPFSKPYNQESIIGIINYCLGCIFKLKFQNTIERNEKYQEMQL